MTAVTPAASTPVTPARPAPTVTPDPRIARKAARAARRAARPPKDWPDLLLRWSVIGLVTVVAGIAFVASFEAISKYAVRVGAFPSQLWWAPPLLVDTFILAGSLAGWRRARQHQWATYPWFLVAAGSGVSIALNIAHAPPTLPARLVSALPSMTLLGSVELLFAEARRHGQYESILVRAWRAWKAKRRLSVRQWHWPWTTLTPAAPKVPPKEKAPKPEPVEEPTTAGGNGNGSSKATGEAREVVRRLLDDLGPDRVTRAQVKAATGVRETRAGQLLREEKAKRNGRTPPASPLP